MASVDASGGVTVTLTAEQVATITQILDARVWEARRHLEDAKSAPNQEPVIYWQVVRDEAQSAYGAMCAAESASR